MHPRFPAVKGHLEDTSRNEEYPIDTNNTPSLDYILISSDSEHDENDNSDEEEGFCLDIKAASFDDYVDQSKRDSKWKLLDGRQLVKVLNSKTSEMIELFPKKRQKRTNPNREKCHQVWSHISKVTDKKISNIVNTD
jgi:hypothetical protein